jgi:hypothetical protein
MGRTNPTYRDFLDRYESSWGPYREALRRDHRADFDRLFEHAFARAAAGGRQNATTPERVVLLSMLLAHERELRRLRERTSGDGGDGDPAGQSGGTQ